MLRFLPDGTTEAVAPPVVFPTKTDPVTGELTVPTLPKRGLPKRVITPPPTNPTSESVPEPAYTLSDLAAGAGSPSVGSAASKDSLKTLDTSTDLTTTPAVTDNTMLYLGLAAAAAAGLYLFSQTDAGKKAFSKPR